MADSDTKTLILDAAERVFSDAGFKAASLRQIIGVAGVNLASIHYHFGSKEKLIGAVFDRRLGPVNSERIRLLDRIEEACGGERPGLEELIEALLRPMVDLASKPEEGGRVVVRLFGRLMAEPSGFLQDLLGQQFGDVLRRFASAFERALPEFPRSVVLWRFHFSIGAMAHVLCDPADLQSRTGGLCNPTQGDVVLKQIIPFLAAAFRAPLPSP